MTVKYDRAEQLLLFENQLQRSARLRHLWVIQAGFTINRMAGARWNCAHIVIVPERSPDDSDYLRAWRVLEGEPLEIPVLRESQKCRLSRH